MKSMPNRLRMFLLPGSYLLWHYTLAWADLLRLYRNFTWFLWSFFSVSLLFHTLFAPWKRLHENSKKELGGFLGSAILNLILRFIGFFARAFSILTGLVAIVLLTIFAAAFFVLWPLMPLIVVVLILNGAVDLFSF